MSVTRKVVVNLKGDLMFNLRVLIIVIVSCILVSCGTSSRSAADASSSSRSSLTGAYAVTEIDDKDVLSCAKYAVDNREPKGTVTLVKILSAEKQVVAGMNYKMKLSIMNNGTPQVVNVVVWSKLDGTKEVTSYE